MELTKKDLRTIDTETDYYAYSIDVKASTYAQLYEITYIKELIRKLQDRVEASEEVYQRQINR